MNLGNVPLHKRSRALALIVKPCLDALVEANRIYLRQYKVPPLYHSGVRYQEEPDEFPCEEFASIPVVLQRKWGDCFPAGTLVLTDSFECLPIESVEPGDRIWGLDKWVTVEAWADKGDKTVDSISLNNGSTLHLTPEHHVPVWRDGVLVKTPVAELVPGLELAQPERLPFGTEERDPDLDYVEGLFLSDGWSDKNSRFAISGQDGSPKEAQKHRVKAICERLGLSTRWHRKYLAVNDKAWALRMQAMGHGAPNKHALGLNLSEANAAALLQGIMADSGKNSSTGRTFTTTSRELCVQTRVLHRMFGKSTSYRFIENHGGLGKNPIYRLGIREPLGKAEKKLRIKAITRGTFTAPCYDIQTTDNTVYLPEHDVTVNQCDDLAPWRVAELREAGENATIRLSWKRRPNGSRLYHVTVRRGDGIVQPDGFVGSIECPSALLGMK